MVESAHLSKSTLDKYVELFAEKPRNLTFDDKDLVRSGEGGNDLEVQQSSGPLNYATGSAQIRELAQVFTHALSAYLQDPETFRRVLAEIRPTEPPALFSNEVVDVSTVVTPTNATVKHEEEILDFSDVSKTTTKNNAITTTTPPPPTTFIPNVEQNSVVNKNKTPGSNIIADVLEKSESLYYDRQGKKLGPDDEASPTLSTIIVSDSWMSEQNDTTDYFPQNKTESHNPAQPYGQGVRHQNSTPISIAYPTSLADVQAIPLHWGQDLATIKTPEDNAPELIIPAVDLIPPSGAQQNILEPSGEFLPPEVEQTTHFATHRQGKSDNSEQLQRSQSQSFVPRGNVLDFDSGTKNYNPVETTTPGVFTTPATAPGAVSTTQAPITTTASLWTTSATVGELWRSTIFLDPLTINQELEEDKTVTPSPHTYLPRSTTLSSVTQPIQTTVVPEQSTEFGAR